MLLQLGVSNPLGGFPELKACVTSGLYNVLNLWLFIIIFYRVIKFYSQ